MEKIPKLIAVCLSTLHDEDRFNFVKRLNKYAVNNGFRLIVFNATTDLYGKPTSDKEGASFVFRLMPYHMLSAIIIFPNFVYHEQSIKDIIKKGNENNIPVFSIDKVLDGCINLSFTYLDVFEKLCRHVIEDHGARKLFLITGFENNVFSIDRLEGFKHALEANGIPYDENNVGYGGFWSGPTNDLLIKWFDIEKREIPDAIICANDIMAITASSFLQKRGCKIPDDCIITGFDGIEQANFHLPNITTCIQDYDKMGKLIIDDILAFENGEAIKNNQAIGCDIIYSQSCGCRKMSNANVNSAIQILIDRMRQSNERETMMCSLQSAISKMAEISELPSIIIKKIIFPTVLLAVNDDIFDPPNFGKDRKGENSFSETVNIMYHKYFWQEEEPCVISTDKLVPRLDLLTKREEPIVVCTVHFIDMVMGYCVFQSEIRTDEYQKIHSFMSVIGAALGNFHGRKQIRQINEKLVKANNELHLLSQRDFMTGLFNRRGFYDNFTKIMEMTRQDNTTVIVISADLDELKYINDNFGHHEGDNAITTVSRALVSSCVQNEICARFGGDEFSVAAIVSTHEAGYYFNDFKDRFLDYLYDYNRKSDKPYTVRASIGCCVGNINEAEELDYMIRTADENMYADKIKHKRQRKE